ncbi:MAG: hypothetical protein COT91_02950 [Candidatus Doudnabacteria bacterium CG10_big_fil_rev_8_21_14_0_10_41_10]|uniref:CYTH domain-containing protein n=1 Tax=Candidatus Doudnabacteria bacterium CG10_big_fil_rev_8_21_14_0_10_41_10 TaxID=1974551 RepID=A0A2H0VDF9_9BACT|nr:MAG: hypothetical protein COT91_02950 [Candidatus Doudnabacteria bacterium CG10_big_fil_rev_8_21_14_0_10_41_10]
MPYKFKEIEVRFLEIDEKSLKRKLLDLGAKDYGKDLLKDDLYYHTDKEFDDNHKRFCRIRHAKSGMTFTYKHFQSHSATGTKEIEFEIEDEESLNAFLVEMGWERVRRNEVKLHKFVLDKVIFDFKIWPSVPPVVELEGESEEDLKSAAKKVGLDWNEVELRPPPVVLEKVYKIPIHDLKLFTFDKIE